MSCRTTIRDLVDGCVDWADQTSEDCSAHAQTETQVCIERAEEDIDRCVEEREDRRRTCDEWDCDVPLICDVVGWVCVGWTWVTSVVCVATAIIPAGTCLVWETVQNTACQTFTWLVRGSCEVGGAAVKLLICPFADFASIRILRSRDEPRAPSVPRLAADAMSIAHVESEVAYRDSGQRYCFASGTASPKSARPPMTGGRLHSAVRDRRRSRTTACARPSPHRRRAST